MTTAWRCAPCQRMRRIQITQWSGSRACNLLPKIEFRCGWLRWREWDCVGALLGDSASDCLAATRAHASQALCASCHCNQNFCPPSGSDTHLQIRRAPRSAATWVDVIGHNRRVMRCHVWGHWKNELHYNSTAIYVDMCEKFCPDKVKIIYEQCDVLKNVVNNALSKCIWMYKWCEIKFCGSKKQQKLLIWTKPSWKTLSKG